MASAANLNGEAESPSTSPLSAAPRRDAVALEVAVNATGTRPTPSDASRELFSEDTATVLLFADGAVLRLSSAVLPGQLIFLTRKQTNREVVCQVVRKRDAGPAAGYVELQFTEPQDDFWGVPFEKTPVAPAPQLSLPPIAETATAAAEASPFDFELPPIVDDGAPPSAAPSAGEVQRMREEVATLRKQLVSLKAVPPAPPPAPSPIVPMALPAAPVAVLKQLLHQQLPSSSALSEPLAPHRPGGQLASEQDDTEGLLPTPDLDFSNFPEKTADSPAAGSDYAVPGARSGKLLLVLVSLLLVVGGLGVASSLGLLPVHRLTTKLASFLPSRSKPPAPTAKASVSSPSLPNPQPPSSAPSSFPAVSPAAVPASTESVATTSPAAASPPPDSSDASNDFPAHPAKDASIIRSAARDKKGFTSSTSVPSSAPREPASDDDPLLPAQLLKSVPPVYPPEAMRNFITGDVRLEALVDSSGRVKSVAVLGGPTQLHQAAIDAIKQYQYTPATKGSRAVDSRVSVTIKFWYNP